MCGITGIINHQEASTRIQSMVAKQSHRGPDASGIFLNDDKRVALGHNRLSIVDLNTISNQPLYSNDRKLVIVYNGEIYNYLELRNQLKDNYAFKTQSDTEVILAAYQQWGNACLSKFIGMFAFAIWDIENQTLFAARDRFGIKPFHYAIANNTFIFSSEIKSIWASDLVTKTPNMGIWSTYFTNGLYDHSNETFWTNIQKLPPGTYLTLDANNALKITPWYQLTEQIKEDHRTKESVLEELLFLLEDSIKLRFRADVPVGVCLSGGLDSSLLLALVKRVKGNDFPIHAFTFYTGDERYDELPWVKLMINDSAVIHHACKLTSQEIPHLAKKVSYYMDEPYGGIPTLGMTKVFEQASQLGIKVLMDGNGIDEAWAGYDYYGNAKGVSLQTGPVQGSKTSLNLKHCLSESFEVNNQALVNMQFHPDPLINLQIRDLMVSKIPRSMRFADRNSMANSIELREPFLDHRIVELGLSQPQSYKIHQDTGKYLVRELANKIIPKKVSEAPKRALQTPQREWMAKELADWVNLLIQNENTIFSNWFNKKELIDTFKQYQLNQPDNSFYIWQMINTSLLFQEA